MENPSIRLLVPAGLLALFAIRLFGCRPAAGYLPPPLANFSLSGCVGFLPVGSCVVFWLASSRAEFKPEHGSSTQDGNAAVFQDVEQPPFGRQVNSTSLDRRLKNRSFPFGNTPASQAGKKVTSRSPDCRRKTTVRRPNHLPLLPLNSTSNLQPLTCLFKNQLHMEPYAFSEPGPCLASLALAQLIVLVARAESSPIRSVCKPRACRTIEDQHVGPPINQRLCFPNTRWETGRDQPLRSATLSRVALPPNLTGPSARPIFPYNKVRDDPEALARGGQCPRLQFIGCPALPLIKR